MTFKNNLRKFAKLYPKESIWMENIDYKRLVNFDPQFDPPDVDHIIVYGVGNGEVYRTLKGWLKKKRKRLLILLEDDLALLKGLLESRTGGEILKEKRVQLHYFDKEGDNDNLFQRLMWNGFNRTTFLFRDSRYGEEDFHKFRKTFLYDEDRMKWFGRELSHYGVGYYYNFYRNLHQLPDSFSGMELFGKAKGIPAFIIGAGPSLNKNGELLKQVGKKGLLFAGGGSSLPALEQMNITPDFAVGIDPNTTQYERLLSCKTTNFPYFYRLRVNSDALKAVDGPKLFLPGSGLYNTASWMEEKLGLPDVNLEEGHNVIHFVTEIAVKMGCNPIVYVGMDLAYTDQKAYSKGVPWPVPPPQDLVDAKDIDGNPTLSRWVWLKESYWITEFAKENPEVQLLNATEGGIGMKGIENRKLSTLIPTEEKVTSDLFDYKPLAVRLEQIQQLVQELKSSLKKIDLLLTEMRDFYKSCDPATFTGSYPEEAIWMLQMQEEPAFHAILSVFDEFYLQLMGFSPLIFLIQRDGLNKERAKKVLKSQLDRITYLKKVISIQLELIDSAKLL